MSPAIAQDPGKGGTQAGFEVDADFKSGFIPGFWSNANYSPSITTLGDDWSKGTTGNAVLLQSGGISIPGVTANGRSLWQVDGNWGNLSPIAEQSVFAGSSNKNGDAIGSNQSPYTIGTGSGGPQKNDITNTFLHSREVGGKLWLFFAAETRSVNGASYLDFEYNQAGAKVIGSNLVGQGLVNGRTVNDFLLVVNYTGGGNRPIIGVRTWLANGTWSAEKSVSTLGAFITTNTANVGPVAPNKSFTGDGAYTNVTGALQMVEGGINITDIEGLSTLNQCTPAATITVKTRSSPSYTSELKDFDILKFSLTPAATATVAEVSPACKAASGPTTFAVSGTYSNGTPLWSVSAGGELSNQQYNVNGTATATVSVTGNGPVTVTLTTTSSNAACASATASRSLTINPLPTLTTKPLAACEGSTVNLNSGVTSYTGTLSFYTDAARTTLVTDPTQAALGATYYVKAVSADACESYATIVVTKNALPKLTTKPLSACAGFTVDLNEGVTEYTGTLYFYTNAARTTLVPDATKAPVGFTYYVKAVSAETCESYASIAVEEKTKPGRPAVQVIEPSLCGSATATVRVVGSILDATYTLTNGSVSTEKTGTGGNLDFGGLAAGSGFSIIVTTVDGCVSAATDCENYNTADAAPTTKSSQLLGAPEQRSIESEAYPNPTGSDATINFSAPKSGRVSVSVYNSMGVQVASLFDGMVQAGESKSVVFKGASLPSGTYYYRVTTNGKTKTSRISLSK
ncbi:T9SS type A sorting domain-containing protein [Hymenobacter tenuis]